MSVQSEELYAEAMIGRDAEDFLKSDVGRYLIGRATQEADEAMAELKRCFPWRRRRITELQNRIYRAESIQGWIGELIIQGRQAMAHLETNED